VKVGDAKECPTLKKPADANTTKETINNWQVPGVRICPFFVG
jgi:hypothetical protein